jgi:hypothetical protein
MAKKRGGSPARRSVIKYWSTKKQGSKRPGLPEVNLPVPKSMQPYLASGGKKRRRKSKKTRKKKRGGSPLSKAVMGLADLYSATAVREPYDSFPPLGNFSSSKNTAKIPEVDPSVRSLSESVPGFNSKWNSPVRIGGKRKYKKSKKGGSAFKSSLYSYSINPSYQKLLKVFSPDAVQYQPTTRKTVANTPVFKPFKGGKSRKYKKSKKNRKINKRNRSKKGGSAFKQTLYSYNVNPSYQKLLKVFAPDAIQYQPTTRKTVANTPVFKPFKGGKKRKETNIPYMN